MSPSSSTAARSRVSSTGPTGSRSTSASSTRRTSWSPGRTTRKARKSPLARQWINLPRPPAEVQIVLEKDKSGKAVAVGLAWASRMGPRPTGVALTFDGQPLPVDVARHARLPEYDASLPHVVSVEVEFPAAFRDARTACSGAGPRTRPGSELTAVPVRGPNDRPPSVHSLQGQFRKNGEPLRVVAVERGPALVFSSAIRPRTRRRFGASARTTTTSRGPRRGSRSTIASSSSGPSPRRSPTRVRRTSSSTRRKSSMA